MGVLGGKGANCFGAFGERGNPTKPVGGDSGGDTIDFPVPSRGILGKGEFMGRSPGRGLIGSPGLRGCIERTLRLILSPGWALVGVSTLASDVGADKKFDPLEGVCSGESDLIVDGMGAAGDCRGNLVS